MEKRNSIMPQSLGITEFLGGGGNSDPLKTRVWGSHNSPVKKFGSFRKRSAFAFTMAEILISLTIIGVIAAIIVPSLAGNIEKKTLATRHKAFYSRMSQALAMIDKNLNKYGQYNATYDEENSSLNVTTDTGAMAFLTDALGQTLKFSNVCDNVDLAKCGLPNAIKDLDGNKVNIPTTLGELSTLFSRVQTQTASGINLGSSTPVDTKAAYFETHNGVSGAIYFNPQCKSYNHSSVEFIMPRVCVNIIYDVNGKKGPNTIFKDVFILTMLGPENPNIVSPIVTNFLTDTGGNACQSLNNGSRMTNVDEGVSLVINKKLISRRSNASGNGYWHTSTSCASPWSDRHITIYEGKGVAWPDPSYGSTYRGMFCVKK